MSWGEGGNSIQKRIQKEQKERLEKEKRTKEKREKRQIERKQNEKVKERKEQKERKASEKRKEISSEGRTKRATASEWERLKEVVENNLSIEEYQSKVEVRGANESAYKLNVESLKLGLDALDKSFLERDKAFREVGKGKAFREVAKALEQSDQPGPSRQFHRSLAKGYNPESKVYFGNQPRDSLVRYLANKAGKDEASSHKIYEAFKAGERPRLEDLKPVVANALKEIWEKEVVEAIEAWEKEEKSKIRHSLASEILESEESTQDKTRIVKSKIDSTEIKQELKKQLEKPSLTLEDYKRGEEPQDRSQGKVSETKERRPVDEEQTDLHRIIPKELQMDLTKEVAKSQEIKIRKQNARAHMRKLEEELSQEQLEKFEKDVRRPIDKLISKTSISPKEFMSYRVPLYTTGEGQSTSKSPEILSEKEEPVKDLEKESFDKKEEFQKQRHRKEIRPLKRKESDMGARELEEGRSIVDTRIRERAEKPKRAHTMFTIHGETEFDKALEDIKNGPLFWLVKKDSKILIISGQKMILDNGTSKIFDQDLLLWRGTSLHTNRPATDAPPGTYILDTVNRLWYSAQTGKVVAQRPFQNGSSFSKVKIERMVKGREIWEIYLPSPDVAPHRRIAFNEILGKDSFLFVRVPHERDMMPIDDDPGLKVSEAIARAPKYFTGAAQEAVLKMYQEPIKTAFMIIAGVAEDKLRKLVGAPFSFFGLKTTIRLGEISAVAKAAETPDEINFAAKLIADELMSWVVGKAVSKVMGKTFKGMIKGGTRVYNSVKVARAEARMKVYGEAFQYFKNKYFDGDAITSEKVLMGDFYRGDIKFAINSQEYLHRISNLVKKGNRITTDIHKKLNDHAEQTFLKLFETSEYKNSSVVINKMDSGKLGPKMSRGKGNPLRRHLYKDPEHGEPFAKMNGLENEYNRINEFEKQRVNVHKMAETEELRMKNLDLILDELAQRRVAEQLENKGVVAKNIDNNLIENEKNNLLKIFREEGREKGREVLVNELATRRAEEKAFTEASKLWNQNIINIAQAALSRSDTVLFEADFHGHPDFGGKNFGPQYNIEFTAKNGRRGIISWKEDGQIINAIDVKRKGTKIGKKEDGSPLRVPDPKHTHQNRQYYFGSDSVWLKHRKEKK